MSTIINLKVPNLSIFYDKIHEIKREALIRCAYFTITPNSCTIILDALKDKYRDVPDALHDLTHLFDITGDNFYCSMSELTFYIALPELDCVINYALYNNDSIIIKMTSDKTDRLTLEFPDGTFNDVYTR